jgi:hypothetical protein
MKAATATSKWQYVLVMKVARDSTFKSMTAARCDG